MKRLLVALLFAATPALAQPYVFAGAAWTNSHAPSATESEGSSDIFLLPGVGYRFGRLAVEAAYVDPGEIASSFTQSQPAPGTSNVTTKTFALSGARLSLVGSLPLADHLQLLGSVSAYRLKGDRREVDTVTTAGTVTVTGERSFSGSGTTLGLGAGIGIRVTDSIEGRAMLEWLRGKDAIFGSDNDLKNTRLASFSLLYRF